MASDDTDDTPKGSCPDKRLEPRTSTLAVIGTIMLLIVFGLALLFFRS
jgi:hypothetical protein